MALAAQTARPAWPRLGAFGLLCVAFGILAGRWLPTTAAPVWREPVEERIGAIGAIGASIVPASFADIVEAARPGVVTLRVRLRAGLATKPAATSNVVTFGEAVFDGEPGYRNGSGFLVNKRGLVVTSRHVIAGAESIEIIEHRHGRLRGVVVGEDAATDIALLRIEDPPDDLDSLVLGKSERLRAGDWIVAVGNPFGFAQTVTAGVVSFVGRHLPHSDLAVTNDFLQISAQVNPGSSGGPVLDCEGRVVGVITQAAANAQGISFAVPSRTLKWTLAAMAKSLDGRVRRGYLGIEFATCRKFDDTGHSGGGAVIVRVLEGAPAERAGMQRGDVVVAIDGTPVADASALHERIVCGEPGSSVALQVLRGGRVQDPIQAVLSEMGGPKATPPVN